MPKHIAAFFVLLLTFLAVFVAGEKKFSSSFQSCISQQPTQNDDSPGAAISSYARCTGEFVDAHGGAITAVASLIIAAFTGTLWGATIRQGRLTFDAFELARTEFISTHRPRLIVRFIQGPVYDANGHECVSVTIVNVGGSLATIEAFGGDLVRRDSNGEWVQPGLNATPKNIHPVTLISGKRHTFTVTANAPHTDAGIAADALDGRDLCAVGAVNYRDGNKVSRETGFFRVYDEASKRFIAPNNTEFEYQD